MIGCKCGDSGAVILLVLSHKLLIFQNSKIFRKAIIFNINFFRKVHIKYSIGVYLNNPTHCMLQSGQLLIFIVDFLEICTWNR